jgi:hypothetical protein
LDFEENKIISIVQQQVDTLTDVARLLYSQDSTFVPVPLISECVEKFVLTHLHAKLFCPRRFEAKHDAYLYSKIVALQKFLRPQHLDIPTELIDSDAWEKSAKGCRRT